MTIHDVEGIENTNSRMMGVDSNHWRFYKLLSPDDKESPFLVRYLLNPFGVIDTTKEDVDRDEQTAVSFHHLLIVFFCCLKSKECLKPTAEKRRIFLPLANDQYMVFALDPIFQLSRSGSYILRPVSSALVRFALLTGMDG